MNVTGTLGAATRKGPYFDFPTNRLAILQSDQTKSPFPAFMDIYGTMPYLYFSSSKAGNDYNSTYSTSSSPGRRKPERCPPAWSLPSSRSRSAARGSPTPTAFRSLPPAGTDTSTTNVRQLRRRRPWPGYAGGETDHSGYDNMSNFHPTLLGIPAN